MNETDRVIPFPGLTIAKLPPATRYAGKRLYVGDLHEGLGGYVRSDRGVWMAEASGAIAIRSPGAITLRPLVHRPIQILRGNILSAFTISLSTQGAWNGAQFTIMREAAGLARVSLLGKALGLSGWADVVFDGQSWVTVRSSGLL